jgi:hypothetical protein
MAAQDQLRLRISLATAEDVARQTERQGGMTVWRPGPGPASGGPRGPGLEAARAGAAAASAGTVTGDSGSPTWLGATPGFVELVLGSAPGGIPLSLYEDSGPAGGNVYGRNLELIRTYLGLHSDVPVRGAILGRIPVGALRLLPLYVRYVSGVVPVGHTAKAVGLQVVVAPLVSRGSADGRS